MMTDELRAVFRQNIRNSESALPIGRDGRIRVHYFLDLLSACHNSEHLTVIAEYFVRWLKTYELLGESTCIVGPKAGNTIFIRQVAVTLQLPSAYIRENVLFGRWIEGYLKPESAVILVDDVASDGELLLDAVSDLRRAGFLVTDVFVLIDRKEGDAAIFLKRQGVNYHYCIQLSDDDLARI
jgi:orotate phosphoribosyltransferase